MGSTAASVTDLERMAEVLRSEADALRRALAVTDEGLRAA
jgi:hypothetical protein